MNIATATQAEWDELDWIEHRCLDLYNRYRNAAIKRGWSMDEFERMYSDIRVEPCPVGFVACFYSEGTCMTGATEEEAKQHLLDVTI